MVLLNLFWPPRPLCFLFLSCSLCLRLTFSCPEGGWGGGGGCRVDTEDSSWSVQQTAQMSGAIQTIYPADIDLSHITAAHNRPGITSRIGKHSLKLDKGFQHVDDSNDTVTSWLSLILMASSWCECQQQFLLERMHMF